MSTDTKTAAPGPPIPGQDWAALKDYLAGQVESDLAVSMSFREMGDEFTAAVHGALVSANRGTLAKMRELENGEACTATSAILGRTCGQPAADLYAGTCELGHDAERYLCAVHAEPRKPLWCMACYAIDGSVHEITLAITGVAQAAAFPQEPEALGESERFQVGEARDILGTWDMANPGIISRESVLADQVRALLAIIDQAFPAEAHGQVTP